MKKRIVELLKKYEKYIGNIEWHIETNNPDGIESDKCLRQLECYREIVKDLKTFNINE